MRIRLGVPDELREQVEARARRSGRPVDLEYGRLFALGLLAHLANELSPLFPEFGPKAVPACENQKAPAGLPPGDDP